MANRRLFQFRYSYERDIVEIYAKITIGALGAVASYSGKGVSAVTKLATAGQYQIALQDNFNMLLDADVMVVSSTGISAAPLVGIKTDSVSSASAPLLVIQMANVAGAATAPASGEILYVRICVRNAST